MKVAQINVTCGQGSTGKIGESISQLMLQKNIENRIFYSEGRSSYPLSVKYMNKCEEKLGALESRIFGNYGFESYFATKRLLSLLESFNPDIVHLHNLHSHNCNLELLFDYIKKKKIKVIWTFHDCWAFTGYCPYFTMIGCDKWKICCGDCPLKSSFTFFKDKSVEMWKKKRNSFNGADLMIVTPSQWLADLVKQSFLKDYPAKVINNGIDLEIFKPTTSDFREKHDLKDKYIILGVAFDWGKRKGLDVFIELAKRLDDRFKIVLVGTNDKVDKLLPDNIISIHRTNNQTELAEIYTAVDLFVNPTREENYPTVNMESVACGTPVLTFKTGGSWEMLNEKTGYFVDVDDIDGMKKQIEKICIGKVFSAEDCIERAKFFDKDLKFQEYVKLYESLRI